jgi:hypothetical protein
VTAITQYPLKKGPYLCDVSSALPPSLRHSQSSAVNLRQVLKAYPAIPVQQDPRGPLAPRDLKGHKVPRDPSAHRVALVSAARLARRARRDWSGRKVRRVRLVRKARRGLRENVAKRDRKAPQVQPDHPGPPAQRENPTKGLHSASSLAQTTCVVQTTSC